MELEVIGTKITNFLSSHIFAIFGTQFSLMRHFKAIMVCPIAFIHFIFLPENKNTLVCIATTVCNFAFMVQTQFYNFSFMSFFSFMSKKIDLLISLFVYQFWRYIYITFWRKHKVFSRELRRNYILWEMSAPPMLLLLAMMIKIMIQ